MNYLQYINTINHSASSNRANFLISGTDPTVRQVVGQNIVDEAYCRGKTLFLLDNTQTGFDVSTFGSYRILDVLGGEVNLCNEIFDMSTLKGISRLRSLLSDFGFSSSKVMQIVQFVAFVKETESRLGNSDVIDIKTFEEYGGPTLVKWKLHQLVDSGNLTAENYDFLLSRYGEVSAAAADFEMLLDLLAPFVSGNINPAGNMAIHLPIGEFKSDHPMQEVICKLLVFYVKRNPEQCVILILDDGKGERNCIIDTLKRIPHTAETHLISTDIFSICEAELDVVMNTFPIRIYSRHDAMNSCAKIESCCGQIDVIKHSYSTTVDKRIRASNAFDMLFGTNRTEAEIRNAPVREARYRKEMINALSNGAAVIDCGGKQVLFQFQL